MADKELKNNKESNKKEFEKKDQVVVNKNFIVWLIVFVIIVTFVITSGVIPGIIGFFSELTMKIEKNPDGTISIQSQAQTRENNRPDTYIGKVLGKKIQFGRDDYFNRAYESIVNNPGYNGYQKYQYIRMIFDNEIENIIGMYNAKRMGLTVSNKLLIKNIGMREFRDSSGNINYDALLKDKSRLATKLEEENKNFLLENYEYDYFGNLPISKDEALFQYKLQNNRIKLKYINVRLDDVPVKKLDEFLKANSEKFKQYRLSKIIFSTSNKKDAEKALIEAIKDPQKFEEIGLKYKNENKAINFITDNDFYFPDDYSQDLKIALKDAREGFVINKMIEDKNIGYMVIKLLAVRVPEITDTGVIEKVKIDYVNQNRALAELDAQKIANDIYEYFAKGNKDFDKLSSIFGVKVESVDNEVTINDTIIPLLNQDNKDDMDYKISLFKLGKGEYTKPYKYNNGFIVSYIVDRIYANESDFENQYENYVKRLTVQKTNQIKYDFYSSEKKKYKVVDNFKYVFKLQDFFNMQ